MLSYTGLRTRYGVYTNNTGTTNLSNGDAWVNDAQRVLISLFWNPDFLEATATDTTVANQQAYNLPYNYERLNTVTVTIGTYKYPIQEVPNRDYWDKLQLTTAYTSGYQQWYYIDAGQIYFWPKPSSNGNTITYNYKVLVKDLSQADVTAGTATFTNSSATVTGSGTSWTSAMIGRYIKCNADGYWYKISAVATTTSLTINKNYNGTTSSGASYTIGEMPIIPEAYHQDLVNYATYQYWSLQNDGTDRAEQYRLMWEAAKTRALADRGNKTTNVWIRPEEPINNPNLFISDVG